MRLLRPLPLLALLAAATALAAADPWEAPPEDTDSLYIRLITAEMPGTLVINLGGEPWSGANGPVRVDLPSGREVNLELNRCRELVAAGDHDGAGKTLDALLAKNPANWDALLVRASSLHAKKSDAEALTALRASLIGNRRNPDAWRLLDDVAKALGKKAARPAFEVRAWVRDQGAGGVEIGWPSADKMGSPWNEYALARAVYRWGGKFKADFPAAKEYVFTFREQMWAMGVFADDAALEKKRGAKLTAEMTRVLAEKKAGTLAPFTFFAAYPEALTATPEKDFELLRPRLEKYFDEKIVVKR